MGKARFALLGRVSGGRRAKAWWALGAVSGLAMCALAVLLTTRVPTARALPIRTAALAQCGCYYSSDCGKDQYCSITNPFCMGPSEKSNCDCNGKNDGVCKDNEKPTPSPGAAAYEQIATAMDLFFSAYEVPIQQGEGRVDAELLDRAMRVNLNGTGISSSKLHHLVASAVDATIGFDLVFPVFVGGYENGQAAFPVANIRGTPSEGIELVEAARQGMIVALRTRNLNAIRTSLTGFWTLHPDFHPRHTGRLYPHGHADTETLVPLDAQVSTLTLLVKQILHDTLPVCGNDLVESGEACDGTADAACNGVGCGSNCTCNVIH